MPATIATADKDFAFHSAKFGRCGHAGAHSALFPHTLCGSVLQALPLMTVVAL